MTAKALQRLNSSVRTMIRQFLCYVCLNMYGKTTSLLRLKCSWQHYGTEDLQEGLYWKIKDEDSNLVASGKTASRR